MGTNVKATKTALQPPFISDTEAAALIRRILPVSSSAQGDDAAKALAVLIDRLASDDEFTTRDNNRETFFRALFGNSAAHDDALQNFIRSAGVLV